MPSEQFRKLLETMLWVVTVVIKDRGSANYFQSDSSNSVAF